MSSQKVDMTFGQLMEIAPKMKRQWNSMVNPIEKEPRQGLVKNMLISELPNIFSIMEGWHKGKSLGGEHNFVLLLNIVWSNMNFTLQLVIGFKSTWPIIKSKISRFGRGFGARIVWCESSS